MISKLVIIGVLVGLLFCSTIAVQGRDFGIEIILGEPTGLCVKKWNGQEVARQLTVLRPGHSVIKVRYILHADYLIHKVARGKLSFYYYGIGGRIKFEEDDSRIGVRIPLGMDYMQPETSLDFFLEVVPLFDLAPDTKFCLNGAIGFRYFFE